MNLSHEAETRKPEKARLGWNATPETADECPCSSSSSLPVCRLQMNTEFDSPFEPAQTMLPDESHATDMNCTRDAVRVRKFLYRSRSNARTVPSSEAVMIAFAWQLYTTIARSTNLRCEAHGFNRRRVLVERHEAEAAVAVPQFHLAVEAASGHNVAASQPQLVSRVVLVEVRLQLLVHYAAEVDGVATAGGERHATDATVMALLLHHERFALPLPDDQLRHI
ncbi:ecdysteroid kinase [Babesia caballi]|uniref:Ecdysteroid kinase n=1 Tax=Babesia caballi TaxID=5871 RepID=A0AAV4M057_BABCB|nr:ecdysteroid kinase [Babesia caballi]